MSIIRSPLAGLLACICMLASAPATAGELYQWTDTSGVTHYSDSPPPNQQYQSRRFVAEGATPVAEAQPETPAVSSQCTTAQANLKLLDGEGPVGIDSDGDGKPDGQMDPQQRASQRKLAEAAIAVHCQTVAAG